MPVRPILRAVLTLVLGACAALTHHPDASAAAPKGQWLKTSKACAFTAWNPAPEEGEELVWTGPCKDDVAHGNGTLQWLLNGQPTDRETGLAVNGKWHGRVVSYLGIHTRYEGEFAYGRRIGLTRHIYGKAVVDALQTKSPHKEWFADGYWDKDELVVPMLYSRFQDRRTCPKAEQARDLCVHQVHTLLTAEQAALFTINQLGRCMSHAEMLMEVYSETNPDKKRLNHYGAAYGKLQELARKKGFSEHMDAAQLDSAPAIEADIQRLAGRQLEALHKQDVDDDAMRRAHGQLAIEVLAPYFKKNCQALVD